MFQSVSIFPLYNPLFQCLETPEMGPGILTFFQLVSILFRNVSKQLKRLDLVNFCHVSVRFIFSLYSPLFQCFETLEMGPGIFTFSRACFNFVSKRFETTETFGLSQFSSCFSFVSKRFKTTETLINFCPVSVRFKNVSKHQKWGLFQFVSKQLKCSAIFIIFSAFQSFETTETIEPFGLVLDLVILQKFIFLYSLCVSMFQCFTETKCMSWVFAGVLCNIC